MGAQEAGGRPGKDQWGHRCKTRRPGGRKERRESGGAPMGDREAGGGRRAAGGVPNPGRGRLVGVWERRVGESGHSQMRGELKGFPGARLGPRVLPSKKELAF